MRLIVILLAATLFMAAANLKAEWKRVESGTEDYLITLHFQDENTGWAMGYYGIILKTTDGGESWLTQQKGDKGYAITNCSYLDKEHFWAAGLEQSMNSDVIFSSDGGESWNQLTRLTGVHLMGISFGDESHGFVTGKGFGGGVIFKSTDGGKSWKQVYRNSGCVYFNDVKHMDKNTAIAVGDSGIVVKTTDNGATWNLINEGLPKKDLLNIFYLDESHFWICCDGIIYRTTDGGNSWINSDGGLHKDYFDVGIYFTDRENGFVACNWEYDTTYIYRTTNSGDSWEKIHQSTDYHLTKIQPLNKRAIAIGFAGVIIKNEDITSVNDSETGALRPNKGIEIYPNPVKGRLRISTEGLDGNVQLHLLDLRGNIVYESEYSPCEYIDIDAGELNLPEGLYLLEIKSGGKMRTGRFVFRR